MANRTKDRIIAESIKLFNRYGVTTVSLRQIAVEAEMSVGNLAYHFRNKEYIIEEIYDRMDKEMTSVVFPGREKVSLEHFHLLLLKISQFQHDYRFFYLDMLEISRQFPRIKYEYRETIKRRRKETDLLFETLVEKDYIKPESNVGLYRSLTHAIWVMSTFWLQQKQILGSQHENIKRRTDIYHIWNILLPHLTNKGLREFEQINEQLRVSQDA